MEKFKKIEKEYLLSDSTLNSYSYRLLTAGYQLGEFKKNPIGYYMHGTSKEHPREQGVLVRWEDLRSEDDKVYGKPCINMAHPRAQRTIDEIENGFLNAASVGHLVALEISKNPKDYLPGQTGPTVTKWFNRECSLVDIPGNFNALTDLVDEHDNPINLADFNIQTINMEKIVLTAAQLAMIPNLKADATQADIDTALTDLIAQAAKADQYKKEADKALADLNAYKETAEAAEATAILDGALAAKKMTVEVRNVMADQFKGNLPGLKAMVAALKPYESKVPGTDAENPRLMALAAKTYSQLDKAGELPELKALSMETFKAKFKEQFKKDYTGE